METNFFMVKTQRKYGREKPPYGVATMLHPDGKEEKIPDNPEVNSGRKNENDEGWELRVLAFAVRCLRSDRYETFFTSEISQHPDSFANRIWLIQATRPLNIP